MAALLSVVPLPTAAPLKPGWLASKAYTVTVALAIGPLTPPPEMVVPVARSPPPPPEQAARPTASVMPSVWRIARQIFRLCCRLAMNVYPSFVVAIVPQPNTGPCGPAPGVVFGGRLDVHTFFVIPQMR